MRDYIKEIRDFLDFLIPRFVTDDVAVKKIDDEWVVVCLADDITELDDYDLIAKSKAFNFFGEALFPKVYIPENKL